MPIEAPWLTAARNSIGQYEDGPDVPKLASEVASAFPDVKGLAQYCALARNETAWCGIFCAAILSRFGIKPPFDRSNELRSFMWVDSWLDFGEKVTVGQQQPGDLALWLSSPHHISFVAGNGKYIGGNQGNAVTEGSYRTPDAIRRPTMTSEKPVQGRQYGITATYFGGSSDPNTSAYDGHLITDSEYGVALPYKFKGERPKVRVFKGDKSVVCNIVDVGPWNINDPYWETGSRPQAESGTDTTGRTTNKAGIDVTPAVNRALGLNGKGVVDWEFVKDGEPIPEPEQKPKPATMAEALAQLDRAVADLKELANMPAQPTPQFDLAALLQSPVVKELLVKFLPVLLPYIIQLLPQLLPLLLKGMGQQKPAVSGTAVATGAGIGIGSGLIGALITAFLKGAG